MTHHLPGLASPSRAVLKSYIPGRALDPVYGIPDASEGASCPQATASSRPGSNLNQLLAALPAAEFERLSRHLELVQLPLGKMLYEPNRRLEYAYFPTTCVVSLHYVMESGAAAEAAGVGNEGVVGISLVMGRDTTPSSAVVQTAGQAYRLPGRLLQQEFERGGSMQRLLLRYTQALMAQMIQTAACNQHHLLEQQLCRFLLLTLDRVQSQELVMTQELIASLLGVRREGIGLAIERLRRAGCISWRRGHMTVLKRSGLEARSCECYSMVKAELSRLKSDDQGRRDVSRFSDHVLSADEFDTESSPLPVPASHSNWHRYAEIPRSDARI